MTEGDVRPLLPESLQLVGIVPLHGDGSARRFHRVYTNGASFILLEGPDREENAAYLRIGSHLESRGVEVPRIHGFDLDAGVILLEDLGDRSLFRALREEGADRERLYLPVLDLLCRMQVLGAEGFDSSIGMSPPYSSSLMVEGEALYFAREFAEGLLGLEVPAGFRGDAERLARAGARVQTGFFLHRDFQSRNIHIAERGPVLIDFQGARPGPLAYDAAALILDPYARLAPYFRSRLLAAYRAGLAAWGVDPERFEEGWYALGAFRLLQTLGAFAKLGGRLQKPGFLEHAKSALDLLAEHLGEHGRREFPVVHELVERSREGWAVWKPKSRFLRRS